MSRGITVEEVWQLALPPGTTLAGGAEGLQHRVEWVSALRAVFPLFGTLGEGYLALARLGLARRLDASLTPGYLLSELHRAHASALVVDEAVSPAETALADELRLPLLLLPPDTDLHQVEREILRTLVDREAQLARRELEVRHHLQQVLGNGGLQGVLQELARVVGGQAQVRDKAGLTVASAGALPAATATAVAASHSPAASTPGSDAGMTFAIRVAGRVLGQLEVTMRAASPHGAFDALYARQAAEICGIDMLQRLAREETEDRLGADLVERLLDEKEDEATAGRLQRLGYDLSIGRRHVVVALGAPVLAAGAVGSVPARSPSEAAGRPLLTPGQLWDDRQVAARDLQWAAQRDGASVLVIRYRERILLLCSCPPTVSDRAVHSWVQGTLTRGGSYCSGGASRTHTGLPGLRKAIVQALDALELGQRIAGRKSPYFYEDLGLYRLLAGLRARDELRRFYDETLGELAAYDEEHSTELVATLEAFFEQNANASQTSRALYVHRNTLNYRLQRIVEISGLDLNDAEARLALQLAIKLHRLSSE